MDNLNISDEVLENLSLDQLATLKVETEGLLKKISTLLEECTK